MTDARRRILVVDDHPMIVRGLRMLLEDEEWVEEVFEADTLAGALREATASRADMIVMDLSLPDGDGIEGIRRLRRISPGAVIAVLTYANDQALVARALDAGATGYLVKDTRPEVLLHGLIGVHQSLTVLPPGFDRAAGYPLPPPYRRMLPSQLAVVNELAKGCSNAQIALRLGISGKTVRNRLTDIFVALGVTNRVEATIRARTDGFPHEN